MTRAIDGAECAVSRRDVLSDTAATYNLYTCSFIQKHDLLEDLFRANDSTFTTMTFQLLKDCGHAGCSSGVYNGRQGIMISR